MVASSSSYLAQAMDSDDERLLDRLGITTKEIHAAYDDAITSGAENPLQKTYKVVRAMRNKTPVFKALLSHRPFLEELGRVADKGMTPALRKELGVSQRLMKSVSQALDMELVQKQPPRKLAKIAAITDKRKSSDKIVLLVSEKSNNHYAGRIIVRELVEKMGAVKEVIQISSDPKKERKELLRLPEKVLNKVNESKITLVENDIIIAMGNRALEFIREHEITVVPCISRWRSMVHPQFLRIKDTTLWDKLNTAIENTKKELWSKPVVLVPMRSKILRKHSNVVRQLVVGTCEEVQERLMPPPGNEQLQVRAWGFGSDQELEMWQLISRFDLLKDEFGAKLQQLGTAVVCKTVQEQELECGLVFLHDNFEADVKRAQRKRRESENIYKRRLKCAKTRTEQIEARAKSKGKAVPLNGSFDTLEKFRKVAMAAQVSTSKASGVILCGERAEKYGSLLVPAWVPMIKWSTSVARSLLFIERYKRSSEEESSKSSKRRREDKSHKSKDSESHKSENSESQRSEESESHRSEDSESHRSEDSESHKSEDSESHRSEDSESHKSEDSESQKCDDSESYSSEDSESHESEESESHRNEDSESSKLICSLVSEIISKRHPSGKNDEQHEKKRLDSEWSQKQTREITRALEEAERQCRELELEDNAVSVLAHGSDNKIMIENANQPYLCSFLDHLKKAVFACARWELCRAAHQVDSPFAQQVLCVEIEPSVEAIRQFLKNLKKQTEDVPGRKESKACKKKALLFYGIWTWEPPRFSGTLTQVGLMNPDVFIKKAVERTRQARILAEELENIVWNENVPLVVSELLRRGHSRVSQKKSEEAQKAEKTDKKKPLRKRCGQFLRQLLTKENSHKLVQWARSEKHTVSDLIKSLRQMPLVSSSTHSPLLAERSVLPICPAGNNNRREVFNAEGSPVISTLEAVSAAIMEKCRRTETRAAELRVETKWLVPKGVRSHRMKFLESHTAAVEGR